MRRAWALAVGVMFAIAISPRTTHAATSHDLVTAGIDRAVLYTRHSQLLSDLFTRLGQAMTPPRRFQVNGTYDKSVINIYLVQAEKARQAAWPSSASDDLRKLVAALKNNAIALPPDIILIDIDLLSRVMINAFGDLFMFMQGVFSGGDDLQETMRVAALMGTLSDWHRYNTIRYNFAWGTAQLDQVREELFTTLDPSRGDDRGVGDMLDSAVAPLLFHEIGHLLDGESGVFLEAVDELVAYLKNKVSTLVMTLRDQRLRDLEDRADKFAAQQVRSMLNNVKAAPHPSRGPRKTAAQDSREALFHVQALLATIKLLRDQVIVDMFDKFRGVDVENYIHRFYHKSCRQFPKSKDYEFHSADKIVSISRGFQPIMTKAEWNGIRERYFQHVRRRIHSHNFLRSHVFLDAISGVADAPPILPNNIWDQGKNLFEALETNSPAVTDASALKDTPVKLRNLVNRMSRDMAFEESVSCAPGLCLVGKFTDGSPGFIELVGSADGFVKYARFAFPMSGLSKDSAAASLYVRSLVRSAAFIEEVTGVKLESALKEPVDPENPVLRFLVFRKQVIECAAATDVLFHSGTRLEFRTLSPNRWVVIEMEAAE